MPTVNGRVRISISGAIPLSADMRYRDASMPTLSADIDKRSNAEADDGTLLRRAVHGRPLVRTAVELKPFVT